jgi:hypothetical protein
MSADHLLDMRGPMDENTGEAIDGKMLCLETIIASSPA